VTVRHLIVTGGNGYIGRRVLAAAHRSGIRTTVLARRGGDLAWQLGDDLPAAAIDPALPPGEQAIIHLAHDWKNTGGEDPRVNLNRSATRKLAAAARAAGIRFVFVSSQSSRPGAANIYGRTKYAIEQELTAVTEVSARVGLVYGGPAAAQYALLCKLTGLAPILPMVDPWRQVQPIHVDEVAAGLLALAQNDTPGWAGLAGPTPLPFGAFLKALARYLHGKPLPIVPIPLRFALLACDATAKIPVLPTVDRERVLGLAGFEPMPCAEHLAALGLTVRPLAEGLAAEPRARRMRIADARAGLRYILGRPPCLDLLRRAVRAAAHGDPAPAAILPPLCRAAPPLLGAIEPIGGASPLKRRLDIFARLAEANPDGEAMLGRGGRAPRLGGLAARFLGEAILFPIRIIATMWQWRPERKQQAK
jgi:nucleoside-diphosphate-sugar epimerase